MDARENTLTRAPSPESGGGPALRPATGLLRKFLEVSDQFERALQHDLTVNATDLEAMEHLLMSGPLGPSELARRLDISSASATIAVDRLVALGHVTREPHPADRRSILVVPTESSRTKAMSILMPMIYGIDAQLDGFTEDEQATITEFLSRVVAVCIAHAERGERAAD